MTIYEKLSVIQAEFKAKKSRFNSLASTTSGLPRTY